MRLILKDRQFAPLFWTQFFGALNDNFFKNALALIITYRGITLMGLEAKSLVPLAGGVFILPFLLFSAVSGQIADRYEKTFLVRLAKVSELIIMGLAGIGFLTESFWVLLFVLFLMGGQSAFFGPLKYGILPSLLQPTDLVRGNAYVGSGTFVAILLGTIMGGMVVAQSHSTLYAALGVLVVAGAGLSSSLIMTKTEQYDPQIQIDKHLLRTIWRIVRGSKREPVLFRLILGVSFFWFLGACILSLIPPMAKDVLSASEGVGTLFLAIFTVGMGIGAYFTAKLSYGRIEVGMIAPAMILVSIFLGDFAYQLSLWDYHPVTLFDLSHFLKLDGSWRIALDLLFISIFGGMFIIPQLTYLQEKAPRNELSRYFACNNIFNAFFMVGAAMIIMGFHAFHFNISSIFLFMGVLTLIVSFFVYYFYMESSIRFVAWVLANLFISFKEQGRENFPSQGPMIIASNHVSYLDWLIIMAISPHPVRFVIDYWFYKIPTASFWFNQARLIPIARQREDESVKKRAFEMIHESLDQGATLGIFPEGQLTRDGKVGKIQPGLKKILKEKPVPIVPIAIQGLWGSVFSYSGGKVFFKWPKSFRPKAKVIVGKPINAEDYDRDKLRKWFEDYSGESV